MNPGFGAWLFAVAAGTSALGGALGMASGIFMRHQSGGRGGMTGDLARDRGLKRLLALVLWRGTWLASGLVALGLVLPLVGWPGTRIVTAGIALFILLRVLLMLIVFVRAGDTRFCAIAALVLAIIVLGAALGAHMAGGLPG